MIGGVTMLSLISRRMPCVSFVDAVVELKGFCALPCPYTTRGRSCSLSPVVITAVKVQVLTMSEDSTAYSSPLISKKDFVSTSVTFKRRVSLLKEYLSEVFVMFHAPFVCLIAQIRLRVTLFSKEWSLYSRQPGGRRRRRRND